jgi:alcohol dehydrogenase class IV
MLYRFLYAFFLYIGQLHDAIDATIEEREILKSTAIKTTIYLNSELARIKILQKEENKMKKLIEDYKTGKQ